MKAGIEGRKGHTCLRSSNERPLLIAGCHYTPLQAADIEGVQEGKRKRTSLLSTKLLPLNKTQTSEIFKLWV